MAADTITPENAFNDLCHTLRRMGSTLPSAIAVRYEAPSGAAPSQGHVPNPTLDTVLDPRRWELSEAVSKAALALRIADVQLTTALNALDKALSEWEGQKADMTT